MPDDPASLQQQRIHDAIFARNKIEAIKLHREMSARKGLAEAKDDIEKLTAELSARFPEKFCSQSQRNNFARAGAAAAQSVNYYAQKFSRTA